tara:strand:+ start:4763 stop:5023 length:261 start_codon:yes stop_codon:yes gene_type:complete
MTRYAEHPEKRGVGHVAGGVLGEAAKGTFKLVAFMLNFFVPGLGTFFVGRIGTAIIQLVCSRSAFCSSPLAGLASSFWLPIGCGVC